MDLISRKAAIEALGEFPENWTDSPEEIEAVNSWLYAANAINSVPSVPAVPLDKLCEWLAGWDIQVIPCNICKNVFQLESCPHGPFDCGDSEHLKMLIKKWMEGQHET